MVQWSLIISFKNTNFTLTGGIPILSTSVAQQQFFWHRPMVRQDLQRAYEGTLETQVDQLLEPLKLGCGDVFFFLPPSGYLT